MNPSRSFLVKEAWFSSQWDKTNRAAFKKGFSPDLTQDRAENIGSEFGKGFRKGVASLAGNLATGAAMAGASYLFGRTAKKIGSRQLSQYIEELKNTFSNQHPEWDRNELHKQLSILAETKPELFQRKAKYTIESYIKNMMDYGGASPLLLKTITETGRNQDKSKDALSVFMGALKK